MKIEEHVDIREHCTLRVGGKFRYFTTIHSIDDIKEAIFFAEEHNVKIFVLGSGSNIVFNDTTIEAVALKMVLRGFEILAEKDEYTDIKVGAGENWDAFVGRTVDMNLSGIEALSAIPGTVGGTPVQNVGAYGQEVKDTIVSVEVFNVAEGTTETLSNAECAFAYRDSIFKHEAKGKYVIISVIFRFFKKQPTIPNYPGIKKYFDEKKITEPTLLQIREAITEIRSTKLPNPKEVYNVGSFFKNPIVTAEVFSSLTSRTGEKVPSFDVGDGMVKIPAGWLIENAGLKGHDYGFMKVYQNNALVLVNNGSATFADVASVRDQIIKTVYDKFGLTLETEPEFV